ncbi:MAG: FAD-dependent oxidoreductase [Acetobacteraceae bacterium]
MTASSEHDVAALDEVPLTGLHVVDVAGTPILLTRQGDTVHAVGARCPHAGGPLAEGVRDGDRVICPWHKAAFCLTTGTLLDPPAVDPLPRYDVRVAAGRVLVTLPAAPAKDAAAAPDARCFVIAGAGAAGAMAAQTMREIGFGGRIVMLDSANRVPYDRTVLSKYALSGEAGAEKTPLQRQDYYRAHRIERRTATVVAVDPDGRRITCADGTSLAYDQLLLATGGMPRRPHIPGAERAFLLRSRDDAERILAQAERSERAVVLGAGFIGMEVAAALRERGLDVTVVGPEAAPFEKQLGATIGRAFVHLHLRYGVAFRLSRSITSIEADGVTLDSGERLPADLVVIGAGITPATEFAASLPRNDDGSLSVDATLRVADGIYAAGDIARFPLYGDGTPIRVEHWRVAEQHGRVAARNMLGGSERYDAVPVFWTIQYLKRLDYIGHAADWDDIVVHGDLEQPCFLAYYVKDGFVVAAAGLDRDRDTAALIALFSRRRDWTPKALGASPADVLARGAGA